MAGVAESDEPVAVRAAGDEKSALQRQGVAPQAVVPVTFEFAKAGRVTLDAVPVTTPD